jgi:hypothetical protein
VFVRVINDSKTNFEFIHFRMNTFTLMDFIMSENFKVYEGPAVTRKQLAVWYGVTEKTFKKMHQIRGIVLEGGPVCPKDVQRIFNALGVPKNYFGLKPSFLRS